MIKTNSELRKSAMTTLSGRWGSVILLFAIYAMITGVASSIPAISIFGIVLTFPLSYGLSRAFLNFFRSKDYAPQIEELFVGFKDFQRIFITMALAALYTFLWGLLFVIPGVIKSMSYALTPYILVDEPELTNNAAIEKSMAMMKGYKMKLFLMSLNFAMWAMLSMVTCGIALLWVCPYIQTTMAAFYEDVKSEYSAKNPVVIVVE